MHSIQILKLGKWPSQVGEIDINERVFSDVQDTYSPQLYKAPLLVTHNLPRHHTERTIPIAADVIDLAQSALGAIAPNGLSYGSPLKLRRSEDGIWADFSAKGISNTFVQWVKDDALLSISPGLYRPNDVGNPTPGRWHLRHIAGLGSEPPAQKGMAPLSDSFADERAIALSSANEGVCLYHKAPTQSIEWALREARRQYLLG